MDWKIKIISVKIKADDLNHIHVYFSIHKREEGEEEFSEFHKTEEKINTNEINGDATTVRSRAFRKEYVKKFVRRRAKELIQASMTREGFDDLFGYEENI